MRVGLYTLILVSGLLLAAGPAAASTGTMEAETGLPWKVDGRADLTGHGSYLVTGDEGYAQGIVTAASGTLHRVQIRSFGYVLPGDPSAKVTTYERMDRQAIAISDATLSWTERTDDYQALLYNADLEATSNRESLMGALAATRSVASDIAYTVTVYATLDQRPIPFQYDITAGQYMARSAQGAVTASGPFDLYLHGTTVTVASPDIQETFVATKREETRPGQIYNPLTDSWTGGGSHTEFIQEYVQLDLHEGRFHAVHDGADATTHVRDSSVAVVGTTTLPDATGRLTLDEEGIEHVFAGQDIIVSGAYTLDPSRLHDGYTRTMVAGDGDWTYVEYGSVAAEYDWATVATVVGLGAVMIAAGIWLAGQAKSIVAGLGGAGLVAGYARVHGEAVLEHKGRRAVYDAIQENPGLSITDLAELAGCSGSTLNYHLRVLEKNDLVISQRDGRYLRFFDRKSGLYANGRKTVVSALRNETTAAIGAAILHNPGVPQCDLAEAFEIAPSTVTWHIRRLMDAGLVDKERDGHYTRYFAGEGWSKLPAEQAGRFGLAM